jgi:hypothetical protein
MAWVVRCQIRAFDFCYLSMCAQGPSQSEYTTARWSFDVRGARGKGCAVRGETRARAHARTHARARLSSGN